MAPHKSSDSQGGGNPDSKQGARVSKDSDVYKKRRERNNIAVRKSRELSREKTKLTDDKVSVLRQENKELAAKVQLLNKELSVLKDLFMSSAAPSSSVASSSALQGNGGAFKEEG